jgi:2-dehydropantoate 2-reductase
MKRIMVFGLGGIGGYVAAQLSRVPGVELLFIARGAHLEAMRTRGLTYRSPDGLETVVQPTVITDDPGAVGPVDLAFLCVKGYDLPASCGALEGTVGPSGVVLPLLNGADIYERVRSLVRTGTVLPAGIYISSSVTEPGVVVHSGGKGNIFLGREPGSADFNPTALLTLLSAAQISHEWAEDPMPAVWTKYLFIASYGLVTGLSGKTVGEVIADATLAELTKGIQREIATLAARKGIVLGADAASAAFEKGKAYPPTTKSSFQRDLEIPGKPNEGDLFGGTILRLGRELDVPTPVTAEVYGRILARPTVA